MTLAKRVYYATLEWMAVKVESLEFLYYQILVQEMYDQQ